MPETGLRLNLGCGHRRREGFLNVDKFGEPDQKVDLEQFPWPWPDSSVQEIVLQHVLEHLGQATDVYLKIIQEIYRVCRNGATIYIEVPHPRHDNFLGDPTHVRPITPQSLDLFSKKHNQASIAAGAASTTLAIYLNVDIEITSAIAVLEPAYLREMQAGRLSQQQVEHLARTNNNVIIDFQIHCVVRKPS